MEYKKLTLSEKLNIIRAGVLGANDGIIGGAGVILGITGATTNNTVVFVAGIAEMLAKVETLLATQPTIVHDEIAIYYEQRGADPKLAARVADDLMTNDALKHYVQIKYGIVVGKYLSPAHALVSSFIASISGGIWPLLSVILLPDNLKVIGTILATLWALFLTGWL
ncbi:VIT1/CCC1 transporter family protein, partial [Leuconostoc mesenteroides]|uniref:VIT1/CCC1 transporter family protein n=1 Tax=Leuconostoc mesenteroides TaxID=1245 RepID=UPI0023618C79